VRERLRNGLSLPQGRFWIKSYPCGRVEKIETHLDEPAYYVQSALALIAAETAKFDFYTLAVEHAIASICREREVLCAESGWTEDEWWKQELS
jgi:hypothetical protein